MITLTCDNCERRLEVDDGLAGQKVKCPACGDVNLVPALAVQTKPQPRPDRAAAAGYPPESGPEAHVLSVRPAMIRAKPLHFFGLVALMIASAVGVVALAWSIGLAIASGVVFVVCLLVLAYWKLLTHFASLEITNKRTVERLGLFSKSTTEVLHQDIRNFQIQQSFWQRIWNVGQIGISSAAQDDVEIVMKDVPRPEKVRNVIDLYRPL